MEDHLSMETVKLTPLEEVNLMYKQAKAAHMTWRAMTLDDRLQYLKALRIYMTDHLDELVDVITADTGKVNMDALVADIMPTLDGISHIEKHAHAALAEQKRKTPLLLFGKKSYIEYQPVGVVLVISPWNYPLQLALVPVISAVVSGNAVILKPSEITPFVGEFIEKLVERAGFPPHVIQVAHGDGSLGATLVQQKPDYIFFTGSVKTGKIIQAQASQMLVPTTLELGGKDPMLVFADAHLARAAKAATWGAFTNSGQVCMGTERVYIEKDIYQEMLMLLKKEIEQLKQGTEFENDVGSMTTKMQWDIVKEHIEEALEKGAKIAVGKHPKDWIEDDHLFIPPILLTDVTHDMKIMREETFGPVLPVMVFESDQEAIALANDSDYGLNASVWSANLDKAKSIASQLVCGAVVINDVIITVANHHLPFGGAKSSGMGRYHAEMGLRTFCHEKAVMVDNGRKVNEVQWYPYKKRAGQFSQLLQHYYGKKRRWPSFLLSYLKLLQREKE